MKILHIIPDVNGGGASKGAFRIHRAVQSQGVNSQLLVLKKNIDEPDARDVNSGLSGWVEKKFYKQRNRHLLNKFNNFSSDNPALHSFGITSRNLLNKINGSDADIIHLHWIIHMLTIEEIGQITKPIVWTFADMWPFCGGEHYVLNDSANARFRIGYLPTKQPEYEIGPDYNRFAWERKRAAWRHQVFFIAPCSNWLAKCASLSPLFTQSYIEAINYPLDHLLFKPHSKNEVKAKFNLPLDRKIILAGATGGVDNLYKGGDLFRQAIKHLARDNQQNIAIALFGGKVNTSLIDWPFPVINLGHIDNESTLSEIYASADVFVMPSRQEAFGQVSSEAQAWGTPVVTFNHGGGIDIVEHKKTGWLATPFDTLDLAHGINFLINN
jgi:glycosyltransferase involved in cell wall biosynthesis